ELAAQVALELAQALARDRVGIGTRRHVLLALALQSERSADALHVHPDHAAAGALAAEGGDREPCQVTHLAVRALPDRAQDLRPQAVQVEHVLIALIALVLREALVG